MKRVLLLAEAELRKLTTPRLLAYQRSLQRVRETEVWHPDHVSGQLYKDSPEYIEHRRVLREIFAGREHVSR
jgi:hypothetical protein